MHDARVALDVEGELATTEAGIRLEEAGDGRARDRS